MFRHELGYGLHAMLKARVLLAWITRGDPTWFGRNAAKAAIVLSIAVFLHLLRVMMPDLWMMLVELVYNLWLSVVFYFLWLKWYNSQDGANSKAQSVAEPGPLSFIRDKRVRYGSTIVLLPLGGWLLWDWRKRLFARAGPAVNATIYAVLASKDFSKAIASLVLLPLVSEVTAAYQASDIPRLLQVVGTGLGIGALAALLMQCFIWACAPSIVGLFEGAQPLLKESPSLLRVSCSSFVSCVLNDALMGILAGMNKHILIGECLVPMTVAGLCTNFLYARGMPLSGVAACMALNEASTTFILGYQVLSLLQGQQQKALTGATAPDAAAAAANPVSLRVVFKDMAPSKEVFRTMLCAAGNSGIRNMALRLKDFLSGMSAARLGNVEGSTYNLQQTVKAYLAGPAGLSGLFIANGAPLMLELQSLGLFVLSLKGTLAFLVFACMVWYHCSASGGAKAVLRIGGVLGSLTSLNTTGSLTPLNAMGKATGAAGEVCPNRSLNSTCSASSVLAAGVNSTLVSSVNSTLVSDVNSTVPGGVSGTMEDYLGVLTPLNHRVWTVATMANEIAAPFDGYLMVLGDFRFIGVLYAFTFVFALLPVLWATHRSAMHGGCLLPGPLGALPGCNSFTGVVLTGFCWATVRLVGIIMVIFFVHVPRLRKRQQDLFRACTEEVVEGYLHERSRLPPEQVVAFQAEHRKNPLFRFRADGPWATWAKQHGTSIEAMALTAKKLHEEGNIRVQNALAIYWPIWGDFM